MKLLQGLATGLAAFAALTAFAAFATAARTRLFALALFNTTRVANCSSARRCFRVENCILEFDDEVRWGNCLDLLSVQTTLTGYLVFKKAGQ